VLLSFDGVRGGERLLFAQTVGGAEELATDLLPDGIVLDTEVVGLQQTSGSLERLLVPDGRIWQQLRWERWGRLFLLRSAGSPEEVLILARSVRKEGP
jgi:hypothetical protein